MLDLNIQENSKIATIRFARLLCLLSIEALLHIHGDDVATIHDLVYMFCVYI